MLLNDDNNFAIIELNTFICSNIRVSCTIIIHALDNNYWATTNIKERIPENA